MSRPVGRVRRVEVDLHEERVLLLHEALGPARREVAGHPRDVIVVLVAVMAHLAVLRRLPVVIAALLELREPEVPARGDGGGAELALLVGVEELADVRGVVAGALEPGREHVLLLLQVGVEVAQDAVVVAVLAGHQGGPGGAAERRGDDVVAEGGRARDQRAEEVRHRLRDQRRQGLVVGLDQHDVGPLELLRSLGLLAAGVGVRPPGDQDGRDEGREQRERQREAPRACVGLECGSHSVRLQQPGGEEVAGCRRRKRRHADAPERGSNVRGRSCRLPLPGGRLASLPAHVASHTSHQCRGDRGRAARCRRAEDRRELQEARGRGLLRRTDLPPGDPRFHDPGRLPRGHRNRRPGLQVRGRVQPAQDRARRPRDGQRRPQHERLAVLHRHDRGRALAGRQAHGLRPGDERDGRGRRDRGDRDRRRATARRRRRSSSGSS